MIFLKRYAKIVTLIIKNGYISFKMGYIMLKFKNFTKFIIFQLFSLQNIQIYCTPPCITPRSQTSRPSRIFGSQNLKKDLVFFSVYERDETVSRPIRQPYDNLAGADSLFDHPITKETDLFLQKNCTKEITDKTLNVIFPDWKTKTNQELLSHKLSIIQQFALHKLLETLLQRCDFIINNPDYNLSELKNVPQSTEPLLLLKRFQDFPKRSTEQLFLKFYKYLSRIQDRECLFPRNFTPDVYLETTMFDRFFESTNTDHDDEDLCEIKNPITFLICPTIINLAILADRLEVNLARESADEPVSKRHRIET